MSGNVAAPSSRRRPRADARRSIDRIAEAAQRLVERDGVSITLEEVAREAGVGSATLYRHFPSRMHLFEHLYRDRTARLAADAAVMASLHGPLEALTQWLRDLVDVSTEARGVLSVLLSEGLRESDPVGNAAWGFVLLVDAARDLLERAQAADTVRRDIGVEDLIMLLSGVIRAVEMAPSAVSAEVRMATAQRLFKVVLDGLVVTT